MGEILKENTKAPDFTLLDNHNNKVSISDYIGKNIILYFYPKDNTTGCTKEACDFRDNINDFEESDTVILGISKDSVKSHTNFILKYNLPFTLLSDPQKEVCEMYGVMQMKKMYGKEYLGISRTTYIIDKNGIIKKVYPKVKVKGHVDEVLQYIKNI